MTAWYRTGTLSVTNGSATVTGSSTGWNTTVRAGDFLFVGSSQPVEVGAVVSNTQLTLVNTWAGATASGQSYAVAPGAAWGDVSQYAVEAARIIANAVQITGGSAVPSDADGLPDGTIYIRRTTGVADYYQKASGSYGTPLSLIGPAGSTGSVGPAGPSGPANSLAIGTVGTGAAGSSASATITGTAPSQTLNLTIPRGNTGATGATGPQGASGTMTVGSVTTGVAGSSAAVTNSGTSTAAVLDFTIPRGDTGAAGADGDSFTHQGDYNSGATYSYGQAVLDQNSTWVYINATPSAGNAPPTLPTTSSSHWQLAARAGVDGTGSGTVTSVNGQSPVSGGSVTVKADAIEINTLTPTGYTPSGATVEQHLAGISSALQSAGVNPNLLINGDGMVFQRSGAITTSADDTYHVDRWYALTQSGACTVTQRLDAANGVPFLIRMTQSSASSQRIGSGQILEAVDSKVLRGQTVALSGKAALSVSGTVRFAVLEWTGTADSVTSDVVNNWASGTFTAGNFFPASNVTVAATGSQAVTANTLTDFSLSATISGSCNNLIVLVWSDTVLTQTSTFDFRAKLERASAATAWVKECYADIINRCYRYYYRLFSSVFTNAAGSFRQATNAVSIMHYSPVPFRVAPTFSHSSPTWAAGNPSGNQVANYNYAAGAHSTISGALTFAYTGGPGTLNRFYAQAATSFSGTAGEISLFQIGTSAWFAFDAEL